MDENMSRGYIQLGQSSWADRLSRRGVSGHPEPPEDKCNCIYLALLLAGVGFLLPYNSFIIAVDYFQSKYPGTTIVFDMSLVYILIAFMAVIINNLLIETLPLYVRITFGYLLSFFTLLFVALFEIWWDAFEHDTGYTVNLLAVAVVAFGCTVQQSSFYGYTSMLPSRYTQAVMTGESAAGLLISSNRILTKALLNDERVNTIFFFCISIAIVLLCFVIHNVLHKTKFVQFYLSLCSGQGDGDEAQKRIILEPTEDVGLVDMLDPTESKTGKYGVLSLRSPPGSPSGPDSSTFQSYDVLDHSLEDDLWQNNSETTSLPTPGEDRATRFRVQEVVVRMRGTAYSKHVQMWSGIRRGIIARGQVARSVWPYMLSIALAYFVTLCLFPGIESEIVSCRLGSWMPVILMAIFNFSDFLGKVLASIRYDWTRSQLVWMSASRCVLVPLLAMCAVPSQGNDTAIDDAWPMILSLLLGVTNGIFGSVPMIVAPSRVPDEQKELTGNIMTFSYSIGLTTGSGVAYLIEYLIGSPHAFPCNVTVPTTSFPVTADVSNFSTAITDIITTFTTPILTTTVNSTL